jgi:hypothetical protein
MKHKILVKTEIVNNVSTSGYPLECLRFTPYIELGYGAFGKVFFHSYEASIDDAKEIGDQRQHAIEEAYKTVNLLGSNFKDFIK